MNNIFYFIILFCSFFTFAGENYFSAIYGYGKRNGGDYPFVYPLSLENKKNHYILDSFDNNKEQDLHQVFAYLSVKKKEHQVLAKVTFKNLSKESYFVHRNRLTLDNDGTGSGIISSMCGKSFIITTNNILLDYLSSKCEFDEYNFDHDWIEIPAGQSRSFSFVLNDAYIFLPGEHRYDIGSLEYYFTDAKWIRKKKIYRSLFYIIKFRVGICSSRLGGDYIFQENNSYCEPEDENLIDIEYFLWRLGLNGGHEGMYFNIRTNQVVIDIDGCDIHSLYDN
ncbi:hypothetical protein [Citrobacter sp. U14242]|uniref:hypothetical protein n=1 Tax=Citrobacter sp. U14242 TaxID=3390192 RepID=UPI00397BEDFB